MIHPLFILLKSIAFNQKYSTLNYYIYESIQYSNFIDYDYKKVF